ncbi:hypothetical protein AXF42_Ash013686 [Apostasia shenzhenica]|uniref:Uncharacterized protein n=1 Tax=Apostasia shenzhenica TaxID=1088818 RepID=A0A2I0A4K3_9ASPA|nr:hypothetical protein AXF42_Ash013686 [Apostasia shenzhenica]
MPELSEEIAGGGYWFRRVDSSPATMAVQRKIRRLSPMDNKENIPPPGWQRSAVARYRRTARTPLPEWYVIINFAIGNLAFQRRRLRLRLQAAQSAEASPSAATPLPDTSPHPHEPSSSSTVKTPEMPAGFSTTTTTTTTTTITSPLQTEETPATPPPTVSAIDEREESLLLNSIEQIEKVARRNMVALKKKENAAKRATQLRTLKSLR